MNYIKQLDKNWKRIKPLHLGKIDPNKQVEIHDRNDFNCSNVPLESFIYNFLTKYTYHYVTINDAGKNLCVNSDLRSTQDIYALCRNYYPGTKLEEVFHCLFRLAKKKKVHGKWFCNQVRKYVWSDHSTAYDLNCIRISKLTPSSSINIRDVMYELGYKEIDFDK